MALKFILQFKKDGVEEKVRHEFAAPTLQDAASTSKTLIGEEAGGRPDVVLFREIPDWRKWLEK